jgi:Flp pilus assembly protein TadG
MATRAIRRRPGLRRKRDEAGLSTVEVVIGTPVLFLFVVAMVALGFYAQNVAQIQNAAQDAARMGSLQRSLGDAWTDAGKAANADLVGMCDESPGGEPQVLNPPTVTVDADNITLLTVTVECKVTEFGLSYTIDESSTAPVDTYRGGPL